MRHIYHIHTGQTHMTPGTHSRTDAHTHRVYSVITSRPEGRCGGAVGALAPGALRERQANVLLVGQDPRMPALPAPQCHTLYFTDMSEGAACLASGQVTAGPPAGTALEGAGVCGSDTRVTPAALRASETRRAPPPPHTQRGPRPGARCPGSPVPDLR